MPRVPSKQRPLTRALPVAWISRDVLAYIIDEAEQHVPYETGGVLMGYWAVPYEEVVIVEAIGPGPNGSHTVTKFTPDEEFQRAEIARVYEASGRLHTYLGDWHSHPGAPPGLSQLDIRTLRRIARHRRARAPVPIMLVLGGGDPWRVAVWRGRSRRIVGVLRSFAADLMEAQGFAAHNWADAEDA